MSPRMFGTYLYIVSCYYKDWKFIILNSVPITDHECNFLKRDGPSYILWDGGSHPWDLQDCHIEWEWGWCFHKPWVTRAWLLEVNSGVLEAGWDQGASMVKFWWELSSWLENCYLIIVSSRGGECPFNLCFLTVYCWHIERSWLLYIVLIFGHLVKLFHILNNQFLCRCLVIFL